MAWQAQRRQGSNDQYELVAGGEVLDECNIYCLLIGYCTPREPSTLESFSRTIRSYVPSSIPIPSASPTPPRVSRPVSFGSFLTPSRVGTPATRVLSPPTPARRSRGSDVHVDQRRHSTEWRTQFAEDELHSPVFNLDEDAQSPVSQTRYPSGDHGDDIMWSRWDTLPANDSGLARCVSIPY